MKRIILLRGPRSALAASAPEWAKAQGWATAAERIVVHVGLEAPTGEGARRCRRSMTR